MLISAGAAAIERYAESGGQGRLIQSIKSHLASELFSGTHAAGRHYRIEELIATFLRKLRGAVAVDLGRRAVVGRPVRYWGAQTAEDETRALDRMKTALALAGFDDVSFEYEPVAAARRYATRLDHEELVVIADFGGGTSDFSVVRVGGPGGAQVLSTSGVAIAGDAFDARLVDHVVSPALGRGSTYEAELGRTTPVPPWLYSNLRRWHHLSFLRSPKTTALLDKIRHGASDPAGIDRLIHVIEDDLGLPLHQSIEANKRALSASAAAPFTFDHAGNFPGGRRGARRLRRLDRRGPGAHRRGSAGSPRPSGRHGRSRPARLRDRRIVVGARRPRTSGRHLRPRPPAGRRRADIGRVGSGRRRRESLMRGGLPLTPGGPFGDVCPRDSRRRCRWWSEDPLRPASSRRRSGACCWADRELAAVANPRTRSSPGRRPD